MTTLMFIGLSVVALALFFRINSNVNKYLAAMNALLAKHTFGTLSPAEQRRVVDRAKQIITQGGGGPGDQLEEWPPREKFGFYALAMAELDIEPALKGHEWWLVRNPFFALQNADSQIKTAQLGLERDHGVRVDL